MKVSAGPEHERVLRGTLATGDPPSLHATSNDVILRRRRPALIVVDSAFKIIGAEGAALELLGANLGASLRLGERVPTALQTLLERVVDVHGENPEAAVAIGDVVLRPFPLNGGQQAYYGVLVELKAEREYLKKATERFSLSKREAEVLSLIVAGYRGNEIAGKLSITPATVNDHFQNLLLKTGTHNRSEMLVQILGK